MQQLASTERELPRLPRTKTHAREEQNETGPKTPYAETRKPRKSRIPSLFAKRRATRKYAKTPKSPNAKPPWLRFQMIRRNAPLWSNTAREFLTDGQKVMPPYALCSRLTA